MSEEQQMSEMDAYYARTRRPLLPRPTTRRGKIGCGVLLAIWFLLLLLPFAMFWLATGHNFTIPRTNIPEAELHPRFQVHLIMDKDNRGLQFLSTQVFRNSPNELCVQGHVNYLLWESEDDDNATVYCECYKRNDPDAEWVFIETMNSTCHP
jgi:hypothetical protein